MARKKNELNPVPDPETNNDSPAEPVAIQKHVVTTRYEKRVPLSALEQAEAGDDDLEALEIEHLEPEGEEESHSRRFDAPTIEPPAGAGDAIAQMLADLQIAKRSHSWTMVVERLPNYDRDGRYDVGAKRVNCGTRPMSPDFVEEIRSEFARPGRANNFRVTIKRDGKIFAHWPEVISLEPPAPEELPELEARFAPPPSSAPAPAVPAAPGFSDILKQLKQLKELQQILAPEPVQNPAPGHLSEEAALLKLITSSGDVVDKVTQKIAKQLFREEESSAPEWVPVVKSLLDNGPVIVQQIMAGLQQLRQVPAAAPAAVPPSPFPAPAPPSPLPPPVSPQQPTPPVESGPAPEVVLLGNVIRYLEVNSPIEAAVAFVDAYTEQQPQLNPLVESFLAMSPDDCRGFIRQLFPQAAPILDAPHAAEWIGNLQRGLSAESGEEGQP